MYLRVTFVSILLLLSGCAPKPQPLDSRLPKTYLVPDSYDSLACWEGEKYDELLDIFVHNCETRRAKKLYGELCEQAELSVDAEGFFQRSFLPYRVVTKQGKETGLMTGYYEPQLHGSLEKSERYRFPVYGEPDDLINVKLDSVYPELKGKRVRGRLVGNTVVPYESRREIENAEPPVLCWVDDRVSLFFLEVQGSGRIALDNGETLYVGYKNQNGRAYRSVGKYLIEQGEIPREKVSLQSIRAWLEAHPGRVDEVLDYNPSVVFFQTKPRPASGALGLELTPKRSVAVDRRYIPLGAMLYIRADDPVSGKPLDRVVFAQDTGGAIRGALRADFFWGYGNAAEKKAGKMKAQTEFWILLPKTRQN